LNLLLSTASAILLVVAFPRFDLAWLAPVALAPMLVAMAREKNAFRRFLFGYAAGIVYWFGVCYWIQFVLSFHGGLGDALGWVAFALFCLLKALHVGAFAALAGLAMRVSWALPAAAALWVAIEYTHGWLGFAWLALGNAGIDMGIPARLAPYTGVYGISFMFAMLSAALALAVLRRPRRQLLWAAVLPALLFLPGLPEARLGERGAVLVQPNISQSEQWTVESADRMQRRQVFLSAQGVAASGKRKPELVVWPEVPAPLYYDEDARFRERVNQMARSLGVHVLLGVVAHTPDGAPVNSALLVSPAGVPLARYDKVNLVPFGEFVPWPFDFVEKISTEVGDFHPGTRIIAPPVGDHAIGTFICYESVFPDFVRRFAANGAEVFFNLSNDGYFGKSAAREQHLKIVRMRAAENRRWILRATNDGITAAIDPAGRIAGRLPLYKESVARFGFSYVADRTVYTWYGDWFAFLCAAIAAAALIDSRGGWRAFSRDGSRARRRP
jgi:apolipoprotein N-acyltransferase